VLRIASLRSGSLSLIITRSKSRLFCDSPIYSHLFVNGHAVSESSFPEILGRKPVGEIVAAAPYVTTRKVGDRVGTAWVQATCGRCEWCQRGRRNFCPNQESTGVNLQGGHAQYMPVYADSAFLIPDNLSYEQTARAIRCGAAWADPMPHERVAVLGIGGLGWAPRRAICESCRIRDDRHFPFTR